MKYVVSCMTVQQWFYVQALNLRWWQVDIKLLMEVNKYQIERLGGCNVIICETILQYHKYKLISWETFSDNIQNAGNT